MLHATAVIAAAAVWIAAIATAIIHPDPHTLVILLAAAGVTLTINLRCGKTPPPETTKPVVIPVPIEIAHQIGFKQGWEAARLQRPDQMSHPLAFERFFPTPPN